MNIYRLLTILDNPPKNTDCFVVLSYAVENVQTPTKPTRAIIDLAHKWWKKYPQAYVIMSTGDNQLLGLPNSKVMADYGRKIGIPTRQILEEDKSKTTHGNLINSAEIMKKYKLKNATLVTYDLHTRRSIAVARKLGWRNFYWISTSSAGSPAYGIKAIQTYSRLTIFIYELFAYIFNLVRGQI
jgi:uncharacterized SAM-binding protein YcdF (DUF218 family)